MRTVLIVKNLETLRKSCSLTIVSTVALFNTSLAADFPNHNETMLSQATPPMWTGFYVGLNAGGMRSADSNIYVNQTPTWFSPPWN